MSVEWFEGRSVDEPESRFTVLPALFWIALIATALLFLQGCATAKEGPREEVCFLQLIGRTQDGLSVVKSMCVTEEQFIEAQK